jgi:signal transduction histidine kinase
MITRPRSGTNNGVMSHSIFSSMRARLMVLVLLATIPALVLSIYTANQQRRLAITDKQKNNLIMAHLISVEENGLTKRSGTMDLNWLDQTAAQFDLSPSTALLIFDRNGKILTDYPETIHWKDKVIQGGPLLQTVLSVQDGVTQAPDPAGITRLFAFTPLMQSSAGDQVYLALGTPIADIQANADAVMVRDLIGLGIALLLALVAAWFGGELFVLRRVRSLLKATQAIMRGDLKARTGLPYGSGELSELARVFDQMAALLDQREGERAQAESEIRRHNRNLASLNILTSAVNSSLELSQILAGLQEELALQLDLPAGSIYLYDDAEETLYQEVVWGMPETLLPELKTLPVDSFHFEQVIRSKQPVSINDINQVKIYAALGLKDIRPDWQSFLSVPLLAKGDVQGIMDLFSLDPTGFSQDQIAFFTTIGQEVGVVIQNARLFEQVRSGRERLRLLSQQILDIQEDERRHIARDLHDQIGQALTALKVNLQSIQRTSNSNGTYNASFEESLNIIDRTIQQVRNLSLELRPSLLDDLGVVAAIRWYVDRQAQRAGFKWDFVADPPEMRLKSDLETTCFRLVQEAITNVVRHAQASMVQIELRQLENEMELVIRDDGVGFDVREARARSANDPSLGLIGMEERVQLIGGRIEITSSSSEGVGTEIRAHLPLSLYSAFVDRRTRQREIE